MRSAIAKDKLAAWPQTGEGAYIKEVDPFDAGDEFLRP